MSDRQLGLFDDCSQLLNPSREDTKWLLYIDGASRRNPGPAGAGVYMVRNDKPFFKQGFFLGNKTNNQAEYLALLLGIYFIVQYMSDNDVLYIMSDSELLIRQMKGEYRVKNQDLRKLFDLAQVLLKNVQHSFCHIVRELNTEADKLANHGIDSKILPPQNFFSLLKNYNMHLY